MLNKKTNYSNEFDIIIINKKKIILLELKNWQGNIYEKKENWNVYIKGKKIERYNPIKQNKIKKQTFIDNLEIKNKNLVYSLIGFSTSYQSLKVYSPNVCSGLGIIKTITNILNTSEDLLTSEEFEYLIKVLNYVSKNTNSKIKKKHIDNIKKY